MTIPKLLQPGIPIVGGSVMTPQWWRWFRELLDGVSPLETLSSLAPGKLIQSQSLVAGNNTIAHGLGATPTSWIAFRQVGAFDTSGGGGALWYPRISQPRRSYMSNTSTDSSAPYSDSVTLGFTPADGSKLIASIATLAPDQVISAITQTGVSWSQLCSNPRIGLGGSGSAELWIGDVSTSAGTTLTVTHSHAATFMHVACVEIPEISSTTPTSATQAVLTNAGTSGYEYFDSADYITEPVPAVGDLCIAVILGPYDSGLVTTGKWDIIAAKTFNRLYLVNPQFYVMTAQEAKEAPMFGSFVSAYNYVFLRANLPTSISGIGASAVTIPHGVREVSKDATNLVINSISDVAMDFWVF